MVAAPNTGQQLASTAKSWKFLKEFLRTSSDLFQTLANAATDLTSGRISRCSQLPVGFSLCGCKLLARGLDRYQIRAPVHQVFQCRGINAVDTALPSSGHAHQLSLAQNLQVLRNGRLRDLQ